MKLEYKVLWFDDQVDSIQGDKDRLERLVSDHGFVPDFEVRQKISKQEIEELSDKLDNYNPYDLIIFDYDLGADSENGLNIAHSLRSVIYTDMIFYSSKIPDGLRKLLYEQKVDGVFIVNRQYFYDEVELIVEDHIKRMSDINNIRGVVMAVTSNIDVQLRNNLNELLDSFNPDQISKVLVDLKKRLKKRMESQLTTIDSITCPTEIIRNPILSNFDIVRITAKSFFSKGQLQHSYLEEDSLIHKVQKERNNLAHQKAVYTDDGKLLLKGRVDKEYNFEEFLRIRKELLQADLNVNSALSPNEMKLVIEKE